MSSNSSECDIETEAQNIINGILPEKSKEQYIKIYEDFIKWKNSKKVESITESLLLVYFQHLSLTKKPSSLWCIYSMLKSTLNIKHNIEIEKYSKLKAFLKRKSEGHRPRKSRVFTAQNIETFLNDAPDQLFLDKKNMAPSIAEYFANKTIFITGATGFMGKVLVEKLLRSCPALDKIYVLIRPRRGQGPADRLQQFFDCKVFDNLRSSDPSSFSKVIVVAGDVLQEELGLSAVDRALLQEHIQLVMHCAACVRFDMPLRDAVNLNTVGTKRVLELAEGMKKLEVFLHVSTSYCRCELEVLEEKLYPSKHRPQDIMECCRWMDDELLNYMEPKLCHPQPNTYAYTKSLTEDLVSQYEGKFPIVIARPSIVTAAYKEPMPGWVDNINGPTGIMIAAGKGVLRTMMCDQDILADVVPVDMTVNGCIILAYLAGVEKPKEIRVCNVTQSGLNPISWGKALDIGRYHVQEFPFSVCLWYPGGTPKTSLVLHNVALFLTHTLPAYAVDLLLYLLGQKTFMVKVQRKVNYGLGVLQYYTMKPWNFENHYFTSLKNRISKDDDQTFFTDIEIVDWSEYIRQYIRGAREYCLKEDPATLPAARKLHRQLYWLDKVTQCILYFFLMYFLFTYLTLLLQYIFK